MQKLILIPIFIFIFCFSAFGQTQKTENKGTGTGTGVGTGQGNGSGTTESTENKQTRKPVVPSKNTQGIMILSKPKPEYTDKARQDNISGRVLLRITFKKNGKIGDVKVVSGLAGGLTEMAVEAAKSIKFKPAIKNGKPYTVTKTVEYTFTQY